MRRSARRRLERGLGCWVRGWVRHPVAALGAMLLVTAGLAVYAASHVRINVDPNSFFSPDLRFQRASAAFAREFPVLTNSLLVVVDADTPRAARAAADRLFAALEAEPGVFRRLSQPGEEAFFARHGVLYAPVDDLARLADHWVALAPLLGPLARDPSLPSLADGLRHGIEAANRGEVDAISWIPVLDHVVAETSEPGERVGIYASWETLLLPGVGSPRVPRSVIVADPMPEPGRILASERAIEQVRKKAAALGLGPEEGVEVRITGYPALNHEEMVGVARDTAVAGALSFVLVVLVLGGALRSLRIVLAAALTLAVGLVWTAAFALFAVGELNPMSVTCFVLVIGVGIDFMIHYGMHFVRIVAEGAACEEALVAAVEDVGPDLVLCGLTTSVGFLAFVPTEFRYLSDLGIAAALGMSLLLFHSLTLFPVLVSRLVSPRACARLAARPPARSFPLPRVRRPGGVLVATALVAALAWPWLREVEIDTNVISLRNPHTESVQTFRDLLGDRERTPWVAEAAAPSLAEAEALARVLRRRPEVERVVTLADFVPDEQPAKRALLGDAARRLALPAPTRPAPRPSVETDAQRRALAALAAFLASGGVPDDSPLAPSARALEQALARLLEGPPAPIGDFAARLLGPVPEVLQRLRANLAAGPVGPGDLPEDLLARMRAPGGRARLIVVPAEDLWDRAALARFVDALGPLVPGLTGLPVNLVESARATWHSMRVALASALVAIALLLLVVWGRPGDVALVLVPLVLAVGLTQVSTVVLPVSLNFVNVIVLPLVLGIGVDNGIHLVGRVRRAAAEGEAVVESTTARAIVVSALTTVASFGTLQLSPHPGVASLGALLVIGMMWTLLANGVVLPALLAWRARRR